MLRLGAGDGARAREHCVRGRGRGQDQLQRVRSDRLWTAAAASQDRGGVGRGPTKEQLIMIVDV